MPERITQVEFALAAALVKALFQMMQHSPDIQTGDPEASKRIM